MAALQLESVCYSYLNGMMVLKDINLSIAGGEMVALLGPNGSGKTTLIKLASGILHPPQGKVYLDGTDLQQVKRKTIAQKVAAVPQYFHMPFAFTVREVVMLGRTPFLRMFSEEGKRDHDVVNQVMKVTGIEHLGHRFFNELSGGEHQKVVLALALAQEPKLLLLDEPTAYLDISHQLEILELVRRLNREQGITVMAAMHDLNLAAFYFQRLILLKEGRVFAEGTPNSILTPETIQQVFSTRVKVEAHPLANVPHVVVLPTDPGDGEQPQ